MKSLADATLGPKVQPERQQEAKQASVMAKEWEALQGALYEHCPAMYFAVAPQGTVLSVNTYGAEELGYRVAELVGRSVLTIFHEHDRSAAIAHLQTCLASPGSVHQWELRKIRKNGSELWVKETARAIVMSGGKAVVLIVCEDITAPRRAREAFSLIVKGTTATVGADFFRPLVQYLASALQVRFAFVSEVCGSEGTRARTLAWWDGSAFGEPFEYVLASTPCEKVFAEDGVYYPADVQGHFPEDIWLREKNIHAYLAVPIRDTSGRYIGHLGLMHDAPLVDGLPREPVLRVFAPRAGAELERQRIEEALRESEERFRKLFEHSNDAVIIHTVNGRILHVNSRACEMLGYDCYELMSMRISSLHPQAEQQVSAKALQLVRDKESIRFESRFRRADGTEIDVEISARIIDPEEQVVQGIVRDITRRKRADNALRRYQWMVSASTDLMAFVDKNYTYQAVNSAYARTFGTTIERIIGRKVPEIIGTKVFETRIRSHLDQCLAGRHVNHQHWLHVTGRGRRFLDVHYDPFLDEHGLVSGVVADIRDITEWKEAETKLRQHQDKLRILASEMSLNEERERRRIAADLHDRTVQNLALSRIKTGALRESLSAQKGVTVLTEIQALIDQTIRDTRSLVFELSPPVLYELGFEPAIEWLAEQIEARYRVACVVLNDRRPKVLAKDLEVVLFQTVRELLTNVGKHAKATRVRVVLSKKGDNVRISVEDDGIGFDVNSIGSWGNDQGGFGLFSVRERLLLLGGCMEISSAPNSGTKITLFAPLGSGKGK